MNKNKKYLIGTIGFCVGSVILIFILDYLNIDGEALGGILAGEIFPAVLGISLGYWFFIGRHKHKTKKEISIGN